MHIQDIPNFSLIIAPTQMHRHIRKRLLDGHVGRLGIEIKSPRQLFSSTNIDVEEAEVLYRYKSILDEFYTNDCKDGIYRFVYTDLTFLRECMNFLDLCKLYQVPISEFQEKSQELYDILILLYPVTTNIDFIIENLDMPINENLFIVDTFYPSTDFYLMETLKKHNPQFIELGAHAITSFNYALNKRQEVEGVAQKIINENLLAEDINISMCDASYEEVLEKVFDSYQIPHTVLQKRKPSLLAKCMIDFLNFYLDNSNEHLRSILESPWFYVPYKKAYLEILDMFELKCDEELPNFNADDYSLSVLDEHSLKNLERSIQYAKEAQLCFLEQLTPLQTKYDRSTLFLHLSEILKEVAVRLNITAELYPIYDLLQECDELISNEDDYDLLFEMLEGLSVKEPQSEQGILITTVQKPLVPKAHHFILGGMQQSFPAFSNLKGIFNEKYVEGTSFPSIEDRYDSHLDHLNKSILHSPNTYVSYSVGDYSGSAYEASLELESLCETFGLKKAEAMPLIQNNIFEERTQRIHPEIAKQLYLDNNILKASVSAFEKYTSCAFSYYLRYGLKLREQQNLSSLQSNVVGSIFHKVLEDSVEDKGYNYAGQDDGELLSRIFDELKYLKQLFPHKKNEYEVLAKRVFRSMSRSFLFLNDLQSDSLYKSIRSEESFTYTIDLEPFEIELRGFIDRIDTHGKKSILIDYKSSNRGIVEKDMLAGLQLQLTTYSWMVEELFGEKVIGSFYVSLKEETLGSIASATNNRGKSPIKEFEEFDACATEEDEKKSRRLNGWIYAEEILDFDPSISHIERFKSTKSGISTTIYNLDGLKDVLKDIYVTIAQAILDGNIKYEPSPGACTYCPYHSICRFNGQERAVTPLINLEDLSEYKEKCKLSAEGEKL